jgi:nicotinamidase/pyrazinamidase
LTQRAGGEDAPTRLQALLEGRGIERVVVVGLTLEDDVRALALETARNFSTSVISEASPAIDREPGDGLRAIEEMRAAGVTIA